MTKPKWYKDWSYITATDVDKPYTILQLPNVAGGFNSRMLIDNTDYTTNLLWELLQSALTELTNDTTNNPS